MRVVLLCVLLLVGAGGVFAQGRAGGTAAGAAAYAQQAQALREIQRSLSALGARMEAIEQQQAALGARVATLERGAGAVTQDDLAALRTDLSAAKAQHAQLREEIVEDISKRIAALAEKREAEERRARAAEAAAQKSGYNHVVEAGQTLSAIAQAYKVSVKSIMKANKISDPTKIRVGQKLFIPDP